MRILIYKVVGQSRTVTVVPGTRARLAPIVLRGADGEAFRAALAETIAEVSRKEHPTLFPELLVAAHNGAHTVTTGDSR